MRDLYGTFVSYGVADSAILVSTRGVTKGAADFVEGKPIQVLDADDLAKMRG